MHMSDIHLIHHVAIVVNSIEDARHFYEVCLGLKISQIEELPARGIRVAFIPLGESRLELIEPMHENSEVSKFLLTRGPGLHHVALKTNDMKASESRLRDYGCNLLYEEAKSGAHDSLVNFIHPKSTGGFLLELVS
jgi:methylmalonyl-CoA/ethylmalonyl-CoA epimerase